MNYIESFDRFLSAQGGAHVFIKRMITEEALSHNEGLTHIVVVHGAVEYHKRHELLPKYLFDNSKRGIVVTWLDLVGHGLSGGPRAYVESFDFFTLDLSLLLDSSVIINNNGLEVNLDSRIDKTFIVAHSMGGLVALDMMMGLDYKGKNRVSGLILSNPCLKTAKDIPRSFNQIPHVLPTMLKKIRLPMIYKGDDLTSDKNLAKDFDQDVIIPKYMTIGLITELINRGHDVAMRPYYLTCPTLFLLSGDDKLVDIQTTKLFTRGIEPSLLTVEEFPEFKHEIFNERNREMAFAKTFEWLSSHTML